LLIHSDEEYVKEILYSFESDKYKISVAKTIREGIKKMKTSAYDLALIDMKYADGTGLDLKKKMNEIRDVPTIVVTTESDDIQKILALEYGADDYMVRPFNILELKARIRAVLRRSEKTSQNSMRLSSERSIVIGDFDFNIVGRKVRYRDDDVELTGKEFDLLYILVSNEGKIFSRKKLATELWEEEADSKQRNVDVHIRRLREKLEHMDDLSKRIQTKWGRGYYYSKKKGGKEPEIYVEE
jgi:two-component system response regulator VicR